MQHAVRAVLISHSDLEPINSTRIHHRTNPRDLP
jgi:hypothetical protein